VRTRRQQKLYALQSLINELGCSEVGLFWWLTALLAWCPFWRHQWLIWVPVGLELRFGGWSLQWVIHGWDPISSLAVLDPRSSCCCSFGPRLPKNSYVGWRWIRNLV